MTKNIYKIIHLFLSKIHQFIINQSNIEELQLFKTTLTNHKKFLKTEVFSAIVKNQNTLKNEHKSINYHPFGTQNLTVSEIFNRAASPSFWGAFYRSLVVSSKAKTVLELGTNLGVGTEYFLNGLNFNENPKSNVMVTIEGVYDIADFTNTRLKQLIKTENYQPTLHNFKGSFEEMKDTVEALKVNFDIVFIDGDHTYSGTMKYWEIYKQTFSDNCILIFDDIYWTSGMRKAWNEIKSKPEVKLSIDLFKSGIIFFERKNQNKPKHFHYHLTF